MLKTYFKSYKTKDWVALAIASAVLSACGVIGVSYAKTRIGPSMPPLETLLYIVIGIVAFAIMLVAFNLVLDLIAGKKAKAEVNDSARAEVEVAGAAPRSEEATLANSAISSIPATSSPASRPRRFIALDTITPSWSVKSIIAFAAIMLVLWSPWIIAYFPAPVNVDLYHQIYQFFPDAQNFIIPFGGYEHNVAVDARLVDHHPFFTTIIYGSFGWISEQFTGNWEAGIFACSLLHAIGFTVAYTASIAFLKRVGCPAGLCLAIWLFFAMMPFVVIWSIGLTKDSTFTLFLIGYLMMLFNAYLTNGELFARPRNIVLFILCSLALCLTKKTGIYIVIVVSLALAWRFRRKKQIRPERASNEAPCEASCDATTGMSCETTNETICEKRPSLVFLGSAITSALVMFALIPFVVFPALNIAPGGKQEALGLAFQQTARYVIDHGDEVTLSERAAISKVLAYDEIAQSYNPRVHDYVKFLFDQEATTTDIIEYLKVYVEMGIKHPESYFDAMMGAAAFYLSFDTPVYITLASDINYPRDIAYSDKETSEGAALVIWAPAEVAGFKEAICGAYYVMCEMPVIGFFLRLALYTMWIPMALLLFMLRHGLKCKVLLLPGLLLFLVCLISPIGATRYATAMICTVILIVGMVCVHPILMRTSAGLDGRVIG